MSVRNDHSIAQSGAMIFGLKIIGCGLGFLMQIALARLLGSQSFGIFATALSIASLAAIVVSCGIPLSAVRFLPGYIAVGQGGLVRGFLSCASNVSIVGAIVGSGILLISSEVVADVTLARALFLAVPLLAVLTFSQTAAGLLQALQRPLHADFPILIVRPIIVIAVALGISTRFHDAINEFIITLIMFAACAVSLVISIHYTRIAVRPLNLPARGTVDARLWFKSSVVMIILVCSAALNERIDMLFVASLAGASDAGIYSVTTRFSQLIALAPAAVAAKSFPLIAEAWSTGNQALLAKITGVTTRTSLALAFAFGAFLALSGKFLLGLFGQEFVDGLPSLWILVIGNVVLAGSAAATPILVAMGLEWKAAIALGIGLCVNVTLNVLLVPTFGMFGAAIATAGGMAVTSGALLILVCRTLGHRILIAPHSANEAIETPGAPWPDRRGSAQTPVVHGEDA